MENNRHRQYNVSRLSRGMARRPAWQELSRQGEEGSQGSDHMMSRGPWKGPGISNPFKGSKQENVVI